jgi:hypothetical protein
MTGYRYQTITLLPHYLHVLECASGMCQVWRAIPRHGTMLGNRP